jgi:hypothetical protein
VLPATLRNSTATALALATTLLSFSAYAQTSPVQDRRVRKSNGLEMSVSAIEVKRDQVAVQAVISNKNASREYLMIVGSYYGTFGAGNLLSLQSAAGLSFCVHDQGNDNSNIRTCKQSDGAVISNYGYIEPGDSASVSLIYSPRDSINTDNIDNTTVSFSAKLLERSIKGDPDALDSADPTKALTPIRVVIMNFTLVPVKSGN